jgi:hypothetical protein
MGLSRWRLEERPSGPLGWRQGEDNFEFRIADCEFKVNAGSLAFSFFVYFLQS